MQFPHKRDRIEIEVFHRLPAQDRVKMRVWQREFVRGGTDRAENFEKINLMKRDGLLPVKRLQRTDRRIVALQNGVGRTAWPQHERSVSKKRADFEDVPQPLRK